MFSARSYARVTMLAMSTAVGCAMTAVPAEADGQYTLIQIAKQDWLLPTSQFFNFGTKTDKLYWLPIDVGVIRKLIITFSAKCAVNGSTANWVGARILVKDKTGKITVAAPTSYDKAFCSGNGTTSKLVDFKASELDGYIAISMTGIKSISFAGKYEIAVEIYEPSSSDDDYILGIRDALLTVFDQQGTIIIKPKP